MEPTERTWNQF